VRGRVHDIKTLKAALGVEANPPPPSRSITLTLDFLVNSRYSAFVADFGELDSWRRDVGREENRQDRGGDGRDIAFEKRYSISEIVELWGLSEKTIRRIIAGEPDVLEWGHDEPRFKRVYRTLRIPESVLQRVHRRIEH
jgi:hypothetical protein